MMLVRNINGKQVAIDVNKGSSVFLTQEDLEQFGIDPSSCSLNNIELCLKGDSEVVPFELTWEITNRCNLNCPFCYIHNHTHCEDISFETAKPYIDEMISMGLIRATLTGGECTLNKDFKKIYKYFKENGVLVDVYTNGILLDDDIFSLLEEYPPNRVEMTIYNSFESQPAPYQNALRLQANNINVLIKFTVTTTTLPYFEEVNNWCKLHKFPFKFDTDITDAFDDTATSKYQISLDEKIKLDRIRAKSGMPKRKMLCFTCGAGNVSFHINSHFELGLCCRDANRHNLLESTFSECYSMMTRKIKVFKNLLYHNCTTCFAKSICRMCFLRAEKRIAGNGLPYLVAPEDFCKRTQEYYKKLFNE